MVLSRPKPKTYSEGKKLLRSHCEASVVWEKPRESCRQRGRSEMNYRGVWEPREHLSGVNPTAAKAESCYTPGKQFASL